MLVEYTVICRDDPGEVPVQVLRIFGVKKFEAGREYKERFNFKQLDKERTIKRWVDTLPRGTVEIKVVTVRGEWQDNPV